MDSSRDRVGRQLHPLHRQASKTKKASPNTCWATPSSARSAPGGPPATATPPAGANPWDTPKAFDHHDLNIHRAELSLLRIIIQRTDLRARCYELVEQRGIKCVLAKIRAAYGIRHRELFGSPDLGTRVADASGFTAQICSDLRVLSRFRRDENIRAYHWLRERNGDAGPDELFEDMHHDKPVPNVDEYFFVPAIPMDPEREMEKAVRCAFPQPAVAACCLPLTVAPLDYCSSCSWSSEDG